MAIAYDTVSSVSGSGAGPFTLAHTCSGSDRVLCVAIMIYDDLGVPSSVTYNGVAMTSIGSSSNGQFTVYQYYLIAPATGSNNISVSVTDSVFEIGLVGISLTGADQTVAIGTQGTASATDTTPTVNVSSAADELVLDALIINHSGTLSVGAGQTERVNAIGSGGFTKYAASTEGGAGTTTMSWSNSTSQAWALVATPFKPVSGSPGGQPLAKRLSGVPHVSLSTLSGVW